MSKIKSKLMRLLANLLQFVSLFWTEQEMSVMHGTKTAALKYRMFTKIMYPVARTFLASVLLKSSRSTLSSETLYFD